mgnify:CR=1 FL=1
MSWMCNCGAEFAAECVCGEEAEADERVKMWRDAAQMLAASNAKFCTIAMAADALANAAGRMIAGETYSRSLLRDALDAYKIARQGE